MDLSTIRSLGHARRQELRGGSVTIASVTYAAVVQPASSRMVEAPNGGGWLRIQELKIEILKTDLTTLPAANTDVTWNGIKWQFNGASGTEPGAVAWTLRCRRIV